MIEAAGIALAGLLLLVTAPAPAEETVFGGDATFVAGVTGAWDDPSAISPLFRIGIDPDLTVFADTAELRASGTIGRTFAGDASAVER